MENEILKEYLREQTNIDKNYNIILKKGKKNTIKKRIEFLAISLTIIILGVTSREIYAKRQWNIKFEEYKNRNYQYETLGIEESQDNGYAEKVNMDYVFQNNIGVKINSILMTDDYFETYIDFKFSEDMPVSYKDFEFGYVIYDDTNNIYSYQTRSRRTNTKEKYKFDYDYIKCLLKELDIKYNKSEGIHSICLDSSQHWGPVSANDTNILSIISMDSEKGFPRSKKLYIRIFDLGLSMVDYEENGGKIKLIDREDITLSGEAEWIFEIDIPERIYNRETIDLVLKEDIPGLEIEKLTVTEVKLLIKGKMDNHEMLEELKKNYSAEEFITLINENINITDNEGNIYHNVGSARIGNEFYLGFDINKNMLEDKKLFLNVKINGKKYTGELIK